MIMLRVEVLSDYGDTCLIAAMTPLDQANRHGGHEVASGEVGEDSRGRGAGAAAARPAV